MAGMLIAVLYLASSAVGGGRALALRHSHGGAGGAAARADDCKAAGASLAARGPARRVALLLRGESFRLPRNSPLLEPGKQSGVAKRTTCHDEASLESQRRLAANLLEQVDAMRLQGYGVDLFGTTFNCVNGKDYVQKLPEIYNHSFQKLQVLGDEVRKKSRQITLIQSVLEMIAEHMEQTNVAYDRVYILRWDYWYRCGDFRLLDQVGEAGNAKTLAGGGNPDGLMMVTARYLPCFIEFVHQPYVSGEEHRTDRCCTASHCGAGGGHCNSCMENFLEQVYQRNLDEYMPPAEDSCLGGRIQPQAGAPAPDWLPDYDNPDDPDLCHRNETVG